MKTMNTSKQSIKLKEFKRFVLHVFDFSNLANHGSIIEIVDAYSKKEAKLKFKAHFGDALKSTNIMISSMSQYNMYFSTNIAEIGSIDHPRFSR